MARSEKSGNQGSMRWRKHISVRLKIRRHCRAIAVFEVLD